MMYDESTSVQDVLKAWDNNEIVWSCDMGGLGPGYEQCIQIMGFEMLRAMTENPPESWDDMTTDKDKWRAYCDQVENADNVKEIVRKLSPSGAQFGQAMNIASVFARNGPHKAFSMIPKDRRIQVQKDFPTL